MPSRVPPVQVALAFYDALNRDDREAALDLMHPDVEVISVAAEATGVPSIGTTHAGMRRFWAQLDDQGRRLRVIVRESKEVAGRAVCRLAVTNEVGGNPGLVSVIWAVITVDDDGLIASTWSFSSEQAALEAAETGRPA